MFYVKTYTENDIPKSIKKQILQEMAQEWPLGFTGDLSNRDWIHPQDANPIFLTLFEKEEAVAFCSIMHKTMSWDSHQIKLNGLSGVLVFAAHRSKGYGFKLIQYAEKYLTQENADLSVLSCATELVSFYQKIGLNPIVNLSLLIGSPDAPQIDREPFMAKARTTLGCKIIQNWSGKSIYFGEYSW